MRSYKPDIYKSYREFNHSYQLEIIAFDIECMLFTN